MDPGKGKRKSRKPSLLPRAGPVELGLDLGVTRPLRVGTVVGGCHWAPLSAHTDSHPNDLTLLHVSVFTAGPDPRRVWQEGGSVVRPALQAERRVLVAKTRRPGDREMEGGRSLRFKVSRV